MTTRIVHKACACLVDGRGRLLVFHHPDDRNIQLPKGTVEPGEAPEDAVRRELLEESGIRYAGPLQSLGTLDRDCEAGVEGSKRRHPQLWHLYLMRAEGPLPERFDHIATGSPDEEGLVFSFSWLASDASLDGFATPYANAIAKVRAALSAT
ncbi:RNA pyrophosphohydrolase [Variovorax sp. SRS16]|uniref:NUDIX domain-containing protein n=1 Tax=Variovorax sp. SRS16 TaxID=282217 RepID=UPI001318B700|nr:NUDIX domain-containing protein [Variovorax sp. SRS16]VTU23536.1 RNA pyrophosphohydrolase [Variovorax sp. SRS16]